MRPIALIALFFALPCSAYTLDRFTGNDFLTICRSKNDYDQGLCAGIIHGYIQGKRTGYLLGIAAGVAGGNNDGPKDERTKDYERRHGVAIDVLRDNGALEADCIPSSATNEQLKDIVIKWLVDHPERRHEGVDIPINLAMKETFGYPCK